MRQLVGGVEVSLRVRPWIDLKVLINDRGLSFAEVGRSAGVTGQMISQLSSRKRSCSAQTAIGVAEALAGAGAARAEVDQLVDQLFENKFRRAAGAASVVISSGSAGSKVA